MAQSTRQRLAGYQRRYRELAAELADLGYIAAGSITERSTRCGTPSCRCHADPPQLHGPYLAVDRQGQRKDRHPTPQ